MTRLIRFVKAEATGNDFIIVNGREFNPDDVEPHVLARLCDRHFGIGADGIIMITKDKDADFLYVYYNADGYKSTMCGNGSRAAMLTANMMGMIKRHEAVRFRASDGIHRAMITSPDEIRVEILADKRMERFNDNPFELPDDILPVAFLNTGVPHLVLKADRELEEIDVTGIGRVLRFHPRFPQGTNVNFVHVTEPQHLRVRTYERGVEAETLSCGTGVTACALAFWKDSSEARTLEVETRGGKIRVIREGEAVYLTGPARLVFLGQYLLNC